MLTISESQALSMIRQALRAEGISAGAAWSVSISRRVILDVDVRLGRAPFGIEWVSRQDRANYGAAVPGPAEDGQLRIVAGISSGVEAQVLVLEHSSYRFGSEVAHVQRGTPGASETEARLRRDVRDYVEYVRGQGGVPPR